MSVYIVSHQKNKMFAEGTSDKKPSSVTIKSILRKEGLLIENIIIKFDDSTQLWNWKGAIKYTDKLKNLVYSYETKYDEGFIDSEIEDILSKFSNLNMDKFQNALYGNTCMLKNNDVIMYHCDILTALRCAAENRNMYSYEWD